MQSLKVKSTTESGLLVAITVIMALMAVYMPILGAAAALLWPLPIIVLIVRHGMKYGVLSVIAAAIIMTILISPLSAVHMVASFGPPGLALGYGFYKGLSASRILLYGITASLAGVFLTAGLTMMISGVNPLAMADQMEAMKEASEAAFQAYGTVGVPEDQIAESKEQFSAMMEYVTLLLPSVFLLSGMITAWLNFAVGGKVLKRLGHHVTALPAFDDWHLPKAILYLFAFSLVGLYWGTTRDIEVLTQASLNGYTMATLAGFIQAVAVLSCFTRGKISRFLFWVIIVFLFMQGPISQVLAVCGLFDMLIDYRGRFLRR